MRRAMSLVELLVVVAILTLLVFLVAPAVAAARVKALDTRCAANLLNAGRLLLSFAAQNRDCPAPVVWGRDYRWSDGGDLGWDIQPGRAARVEGGAPDSIWACSQNRSSYVGNALALGVDQRDWTPAGAVVRVNTTKWHEPGRLILAYDMQPDLFEMPRFANLVDPDVADVSSEFRTVWSLRQRDPVVPAALFALGPHQREAFGVLFADGHAQVDLFPGADRAVFWSGPRWWGRWNRALWPPELLE